jgi:hypothetical protein
MWCAVLAAGLLAGTVAAEEAKSPYLRVATGKAPKKDGERVYTNADLEKMFGVIVELSREEAANETETAPVDSEASAEEAAKPAKGSDSLKWLRQRQEAQRAHSVALAEAEAALNAARENLSKVERQQLAARNPFSARPDLSEEEKERRREGGETAAQRFERTTQLLEQAREQVRAAEAVLARLRAQRP